MESGVRLVLLAFLNVYQPFSVPMQSLYSSKNECMVPVNFMHPQPILQIIVNTDVHAMFEKFIRCGYPAWPILRERLDAFAAEHNPISNGLLRTAVLGLAAKFAGNDAASRHYLTQSSNAIIQSSLPPQDEKDKVFINLYCVTPRSSLPLC